MSNLYLGSEGFGEELPNASFFQGDSDYDFLHIIQNVDDGLRNWLSYDKNETRQIRDYLNKLLKD